MTVRQKESFHKTINTILLSVIAIFGVSSVALLIGINNKVNEIAITQAVEKAEIDSLTRRVAKLELHF